MEDFLRVLQDRLDKKLHKAEQAYVRQKNTAVYVKLYP
jgi:hypothetical protein